MRMQKAGQTVVDNASAIIVTALLIARFIEWRMARRWKNPRHLVTPNHRNQHHPILASNPKPPSRIPDPSRDEIIIHSRRELHRLLRTGSPN
ncbi:hypothetical protein BDN71DRAFT_1442678 [Pleurotus eryngii]|uniref:Uncharacterized protein n=1 Tax=Pleurotus eryngii TaxID=5323 RepID=A0A9P6A3U2_PLEER|nr:hypothetical protein BDN71DRAFT_1442678 [Pleurotus eryngii]